MNVVLRSVQVPDPWCLWKFLGDDVASKTGIVASLNIKFTFFCLDSHIFRFRPQYPHHHHSHSKVGANLHLLWSLSFALLPMAPDMDKTESRNSQSISVVLLTISSRLSSSLLANLRLWMLGYPLLICMKVLVSSLHGEWRDVYLYDPSRSCPMQ